MLNMLAHPRTGCLPVGACHRLGLSGAWDGLFGLHLRRTRGPHLPAHILGLHGVAVLALPGCWQGRMTVELHDLQDAHRPAAYQQRRTIGSKGDKHEGKRGQESKADKQIAPVRPTFLKPRLDARKPVSAPFHPPEYPTRVPAGKPGRRGFPGG
jgi:hypothetical protein